MRVGGEGWVGGGDRLIVVAAVPVAGSRGGGLANSVVKITIIIITHNLTNFDRSP